MIEYISQLREDHYNHKLISYIKKHGGDKTEQDFLIESIDLNKAIINNLENTSIDAIRKFVTKEALKIGDETRPRFHQYVEQRTNSKKEEIENRKSECKRIIFQLEIRLNRFPSQATQISTNIKPKGIQSEYPFYCQIGALFAQGLIKAKTTKGLGNRYFYNNYEFDSVNRLAEYIQINVLKTKKHIRQIIDASLKNDNKTKNFYRNKRMYDNTISYCKYHKIEIIEDFKLQ